MENSDESVAKEGTSAIVTADLLISGNEISGVAAGTLGVGTVGILLCEEWVFEWEE